MIHIKKIDSKSSFIEKWTFHNPIKMKISSFFVIFFFIFTLKMFANDDEPKTKVTEKEKENKSEKLLQAKIIASIPEQNLVMISAGKVEGTKKGDNFTVYKKGVYIGTGEVIEIHPNMSAGKINDEKIMPTV